MRKEFIRIAKGAAVGAVDVIRIDAAGPELHRDRRAQIDMRLAAAFDLSRCMGAKEASKFLHDLDPHFKIAWANRRPNRRD